MSKTVEHKHQDGFVTPVLVDDWGYQGWFLKALYTGPFNTISFNEQDPTLQLKAGDKVIVRWPDGTKTPEVLKSRKSSSHINDMGHEYNVEFDQVYLSITTNGVKTELTDLTKVWIKRA